MERRHFINARIVTRDRIIEGDLRTGDGIIRDIAKPTSSTDCETVDFAGDYLLPGLIEIHTDNLEKNIQPRPGVIWPSILTSALAHDVQIIGSGITTVLNALAIGGLRTSSLREQVLDESFQAICRGQEQDLFKAEHRLHLRCEVGDDRMEANLGKYGEHPLVKMISVMDHTPGQRQWTDLDKWRLYHRDKRWSDQQAEQVRLELLEKQQLHAENNRATAFRFARERKIPLASHDDTTVTDAEDSAAAGVAISEFPTTLAAADTARQLGMSVVMGSPNVVRGGSHSGNVSAIELARRGLLDGMSSDYVPVSLLHAAFILSETLQCPLPRIVAMVSANIAGMIGLNDQGEIDVDKRADLVRVSLVDGLPVVKNVWRAGTLVA